MSSFLRPSLSPKCPKTRPPSGRKTKPIQYVANDRSVACSGSVALGKNTCGKTAAAATPYRKKSYHSTVVPTRLAPTVRAMGDLRRVVSGSRALVWDMSVLLGTGWDALPVCRWAGWCGAIRRGDAGGGAGWCGSARGPAAVHREGRAGDRGRGGPAEEGDQVGDLGRLDQPLHGDRLEQHLLEHLGLGDAVRGGLVGDLLLHQGRAHVGRVHTVARDAVRGALQGDHLAQALEAVLGRDVR